MAVFDNHKNFAYSIIATAPVGSANTFILRRGDGALFPTPPFNAVIWPASSLIPTASNAEVIRILNITDDTVTFLHDQEGSIRKPIFNGHQIGLNITAKVITDIENAINGISTTPSGPAGGDLTGTYPNPTVNFSSDTLHVLKTGDTMTGALIITNAPASGTPGTASQINTGDPNTKGQIIKANTYTPAGSQPNTVSGLILWFKADAGTNTTTNGAAISSWLDQSSTACTVTQGTGGNQPTYTLSTALLNNKPSIHFTTSTWLEATSNIPNPSAGGLTLMWVYVDNGSTTDAGIFGLTSAGNSDWNQANGLSVNAGASGATIQVQRQTGGNPLGMLSSISTSTPYVITLKLNAGTATLYVNGVSATTDTYSDTATIAATILDIGARRVPSIAKAMPMDFAECIMYSSALGDTDRQNVEAYLATKYNIAVTGVSTAQVSNLSEWQSPSGVVTASIGPTGSLLVAPSTNTTTALVVKTSTGATVFGVDTLNGGRVGIGAAPASQTALLLNGTVIASGTVAQGISVPSALTLQASANGDILRGIIINPTFTDGSFTGVLHYSIYSNSTAQSYFAGNIGIGQTTTTARLHLPAGTATANTAPLKLTTGTFLTAAEAGALEFVTDVLSFTTTTGAIRKTIPLGVSARSTAQTAAVTSVATYTLGASDASFKISANVLVTTSTAHSFTVTCTYTDEGNTSRTLTLNFSQLAGTLITAITNVTSVGPYEGVPVHIRCKASTAITLATVGTFTTVTYNVEGSITQIA